MGIRDQEKSKKYENLVENTPKLISKLPWPQDFFNTPLIIPEFIALDLVNFSSNDCPLYISLPNYVSIREVAGTKNLFFPNSHENFYEEVLNFCEKEDIEILEKLGAKAFNFHLALHELLGDASLKFLRKEENGNFNFDINHLINPMTNSLFDK